MAPEPDAARIPAASRAALVGVAIAAGVVLAFRWT
jgi:hypothetical protein